MRHRRAQTWPAFVFALMAWGGLVLTSSACAQDTVETPKSADAGAASAPKPSAQPDDAKPPLARILAECEKVNKQLTDLTADMAYIRVIKALDQKDERLGELKFKKPRKIFIKFTKPEEKHHIVNEEAIWVYTPEEKQAERYPVSKGRQRETGFIDFGFGGSVDDVKKSYTISLLETQRYEGKESYLLELKPKSDELDTPYSKTMLRVEEGRWLPIEVTLFESDGEIITTITLTNIRVNPGLPDKVFEFKLPRGVRLVEP